MDERETRLFVGMKISPKLQRELDNCIRKAERYVTEDQPESLQIVTLGEKTLIGRFLRDGFPVRDIDNVSRNIRSIVTRMTRGLRITEDSIHLYADPTVPMVLLREEQARCLA
ncbi:MAG: hypothetical protein AB7P69_27205 [Candidatus Binatia bacterium]